MTRLDKHLPMRNRSGMMNKKNDVSCTPLLARDTAVGADRPAPVICAVQFERLLAEVGPAVAPDLIVQLCVDISAAQRSLLAAVDAVDRAAIRAQSHILIGLAGVIGAKDLHRLAVEMNDCAQLPVPDAHAIVSLASSTGRAIDAVMLYLARPSAGLAPA